MRDRGFRAFCNRLIVAVVAFAALTLLVAVTVSPGAINATLGSLIALPVLVALRWGS